MDNFDDDFTMSEDIHIMLDELEQQGNHQFADNNDFQSPSRKKQKLDTITSQVQRNDSTCVICMEKDASILFNPCRHLVTCDLCAKKLQDECPLCKKKIKLKISDIASLYNIKSNVLNKSLVCVRAIITSEQQDIFLKSPAQIKEELTCENEDDKMYLWFPYFNNRLQENNKYGMNVTGIVILEGLYELSISEHQSIPIGVLFLKQNFSRKSILLHSFFTKYDLKEHCELRWFSLEDILEFSNYLNENDQQFEWSYLIYKARELHRRKGTVRNKCAISHSLVTDTLAFTAEFQLWIERSKLFDFEPFDLETHEPGEQRLLTPIEQLWIFCHIRCRYAKKWMLSSVLLKFLIRNMSVTTCPIDPSFLIDRITEEVASKCACVAAQNHTADMMIQSFFRLFAHYQTNAKAYKDNIGDTMDVVKQSFPEISLKISHLTVQKTQQSISCAPTNIFDNDKVPKWCNKIGKELKEEFLPEKIYGSVYSNLKCVMQKNGIFLLYDTRDHLLETVMEKLEEKLDCKAAKVYSSSTKFLLHSGKLSDVESEPPAAQTISRNQAKHFYETYAHLKSTQKKLVEASITKTPIWSTQTAHKIIYHRLVPCDKGLTIKEALEKLVYPSDNSNKFCHELINPRFHVSTLILDIDIKPSYTCKPIKRLHFFKDLMKVTESIFEKCDLKERCLYYFFQSNKGQGEVIKWYNDEEDKKKHKFGFHCHIRLPHDTVFSVKACKQFIEILNDVRYCYPETLGMPVNGTSNIFDTAIYSEKSFHLIRGPFQTKADGSAQLECVYRSDGGSLKDIPLEHKLVHSPHLNPETNKTVVLGRIIEKFKNIELINDITFLKEIGEYTINNYADRKCHSSIFKIMDEINTKCILFSTKRREQDIKRLERMSNDLWKISKINVLKRMESDDHTVCEIEMMKCTMFKYNPTNNKLMLVLGRRTFNLPFCPLRAHENPVTSTRAWIAYNRNMVRMNLFVFCFKTSCEKKKFMLDGQLSFNFPFFTENIKEEVKTFIATSITEKHVLIEISTDEEDTQSYCEKYINTNNFPITTYIKDHYSIHHLYAFVSENDVNFLFCLTKASVFIAIISKQKTHTIIISKNDSMPLLKYLHQESILSQALLKEIIYLFKTEKNI